MNGPAKEGTSDWTKDWIPQLGRRLGNIWRTSEILIDWTAEWKNGRNHQYKKNTWTNGWCDELQCLFIISGSNEKNKLRVEWTVFGSTCCCNFIARYAATSSVSLSGIAGPESVILSKSGGKNTAGEGIQHAHRTIKSQQQDVSKQRSLEKIHVQVFRL